MKSVLVLGGGLVGRPIALDLQMHGNFIVSVADKSAVALEKLASEGIEGLAVDLSDTAQLEKLLPAYDMFVNAVPGSLGFDTLKVLVKSGKPVVDIAFYAQDPRELHPMALAHGSCVICDMGVAPGMSHLLSGYAASLLSHIEELRILVGGLPQQRILPWQYKAVFSPSDVIEEYTRPARLVRNGHLVSLPALSEPELVVFDEIGSLEAFNSDGLRTLLHHIKADHMVEKTLRYPGHLDAVKLLSESGFFADEPITVNGKECVPRQLTSNLLFEQWKLHEGEADLTVMRIEAKGTDRNGRHRKQLRWELVDRYDASSGIHSMARTTGYAATAALRLLASGALCTAGIHMPEQLGKREQLVQFILDDLKKKDIHYRFSEKLL